MRRAPRIAVLGAGPAGLAAAWTLLRGGAEVEVFEASEGVGGLARSLSLWGKHVDLGPHIFAGGHTRALALWGKLLGRAPHRLPLRRGIATHGRVLEYPVKPLDAMRKLPASALLGAAMGYGVARLGRPSGSPQAENAEDWVVARYGRPLYDLLLRSYLEKLWARSGRDVDATFAQALFGEAQRPRASPSVPAGDHFDYPREGSGAAWSRLADRLRGGATVHLGARVEALLVEDGRVRVVRAGALMREVDGVVSSLALRHLVALLPTAPAPIAAALDGLCVRHAMVVHLRVQGAPALPYLWMYVYAPDLRVGRVSDWRSWHPHGPRHQETVVTLEYWCGGEDALWRADDTTVTRAAALELTASGLFPGAEACDGHVTRLPGALPVPARGYLEPLRLVGDYLASVGGLHVIGRQGRFTQASMADAVGEGLDAADALLRSDAAAQ